MRLYARAQGAFGCTNFLSYRSVGTYIHTRSLAHLPHRAKNVWATVDAVAIRYRHGAMCFPVWACLRIDRTLSRDILNATEGARLMIRTACPILHLHRPAVTERLAGPDRRGLCCKM